MRCERAFQPVRRHFRGIGHAATAVLQEDQAMVEKQNEIERTFALKIEGMHCPNCEGVIERRFGALPGVRRVEVNYRTGKAEVGYEGSLSVSDLNNAVEEEG